jgi:hypothetical protein
MNYYVILATCEGRVLPSICNGQGIGTSASLISRAMEVTAANWGSAIQSRPYKLDILVANQPALISTEVECKQTP